MQPSADETERKPTSPPSTLCSSAEPQSCRVSGCGADRGLLTPFPDAALLQLHVCHIPDIECGLRVPASTGFLTEIVLFLQTYPASIQTQVVLEPYTSLNLHPFADIVTAIAGAADVAVPAVRGLLHG
jgi:hypothetical protein